MMELKKVYSHVKFSSQRLKEIFEFWKGSYNELEDSGIIERKIKNERESWKYDSDVEFFSEYDKQHSYSSFYKSFYLKRKKDDPYLSISLNVTFHYNDTSVTVKGVDRLQILEIKNFIEEDINSYALPQIEQKTFAKPEIKPVIFIGHGASTD